MNTTCFRCGTCRNRTCHKLGGINALDVPSPACPEGRRAPACPLRFCLPALVEVLPVAGPHQLHVFLCVDASGQVTA